MYTRQGEAVSQNLYQSIETNLALAKHAETWEWKELEKLNEEANLP